MTTQLTQNLRDKAATLVTQHVQIQTILENVQTDADFEVLSSSLIATYQNAEDAFLLNAEAIGQHHYSINYDGTPFVIRCCEDFEEVQVDRLVILEVV